MQKQTKQFVLTWIALMVLLALTAGSSFLRLGAWNGVINLAIAVAKMLLVVSIFMHLRERHSLVRLFAVTGLAALALLFVLAGADYATRHLHPAVWQAPQQLTPHFQGGG